VPEGTTSGAVLSVEGLGVRIAGRQVLGGVDFAIAPGEFTGLIGSNGAGKTTTLRTISGLVHPAGGTILLAGRPINEVSADRRVRLGLCQAPEGRRLFPRMSVLDNLLLGAYTRNDGPGIQSDLERVYRLFPRVKERLSQIAGTLSGGEQQMLAIGRAVMARPKVLMLDEPSLGLAPMMVDTIFGVIAELNGEGIPILLVEQNAQKALEIADRAYVLETGSIVMQGPGRELLQSEDVTRAYLGM
jgi:branched-chain amino acid transport system ATP-binding protein